MPYDNEKSYDGVIHLDDRKHDLEGLDGLPDDVKQEVGLARDQARLMMEKLEPRHISGWFDLISKLEEALYATRKYYEIKTRLEKFINR